MRGNRRKSFTASMTALLCTVLLLTGTFAWQSISQTARNEIMGEALNPGGRLHDDFNGNEGIKRVYVENYTDTMSGRPIIARIRLYEYMEIDGNVLSVDTYGNTSKKDVETTWHIHKYGEEADTNETHHKYWTWTMGGQTTYLPTSNKDNTSLLPDRNGTYEGIDQKADEGTPYDDYVDYSKAEDETIKQNVKQTIKGTVMSMDEWEAAGSKLGDYWVYDEDGWAYWANPLMPNTATGLLLNGVKQGIIPGSWYYAIWVQCQMVTSDDLGDLDGTGFYGENEEPTESAENLLKALQAVMNVNTVSMTSVYEADSLLTETEEEAETEIENTEEEIQSDIEGLPKNEETEISSESTGEEPSDEPGTSSDPAEGDTDTTEENTSKEPETPSDTTGTEPDTDNADKESSDEINESEQGESDNTESGTSGQPTENPAGNGNTETTPESNTNGSGEQPVSDFEGTLQNIAGQETAE